MELRNLGANKTELQLNNGNVVFFSYNTPVAALILGKGYIRTDRRYSVTTSKHIGQWLGGVDAKTVPQAEIDSLL